MYLVGAVRRYAVSLTAILSSLAILHAQTQCLNAQIPFSPQSTDSSVIEPPREVTRLLKEAEKEIGNSNWGVATKALGLVLGIEPESLKMEGGGQDYFLTNDEKYYKNTVHQTALDLFNSLPEAGQETVEIRYGIQAEQEIEKASSVNDWQKIDNLAGKYVMTNAGRQAAFLAAEHQIAIGNPAWAAARWESLTQWDAARKQFGPVLGLAAASAWKAASQPERAKRLITDMSKQFGTQNVELNGIKFNLQDVEDSYNKLDIEHLLHRSEKQSAPKVQGGSLDRNADSFAGLPLPFESWIARLHESSRHESAAQKIIEKSGVKDSLIPSRSAVVVAPHLVVMTYDQRIHGINLQTGTLEWVSAFAGTPRYMKQETGEYEESRRQPQDDLVFRIWGQKAIGQLAADSNFIYTVVDQPSIDTAENLQRGVNATIAMQQVQHDYNVLQAYSILRQAALVWEVGGDDGLAEPLLANVLFLGPPLPVNNELFVIGELNGEVLLFSLNPANGKLLWKQQLAANNSISIAKDSVRRSFGCSPSFYEGVLLCPTLSTQLVAVDLVSRSLLWKQQYTPSTETTTSGRAPVFGIQASTPYKPLDFRSAETSVIVGNGVAIYSPPDSSDTFAVNIHTGNKLWKLPDRRVQYVGSIVGDCAVISTGIAVCGLDLKTGRQRWTADLKSDGVIVGRLARNGDKLLVPLSNKKIVELDVSNGKETGSMQVDESLGNLIATNDSLISISPISVACYPIHDQVKKRIEADLVDQNDSPSAKATLAEIALAESNVDLAFKLGLEAYKQAPKDAKVKWTLRNIAIKAVERDFEKFLPAVMEIKDLMETGPKRDDFARMLIRGLIPRKQYDEALERLVTLALSKSSDLHANDLGQAGVIDDLNTYHKVLEESWIAASFDRLFQNASDEAKERAFTRIRQRIETSTASSSSVSLIGRYMRYVPQASYFYLYRALDEYSSKSYLTSEYFACQAYELAGRLQDKAVAEEIQHNCDTVRLLTYRDVGRYYSVVQLAKKLGIKPSEVRGLNPEAIASSKLFAGMPAIRFENSNNLPVESPDVPNKDLETDRSLSRYVDASNDWQTNEVIVDRVDVENQSIVYGELSCKRRTVWGDALREWDVKLMNNSLDIIDPTYLSTIHVLLDQGQNPFVSTKGNCMYVNSLVLLQRGNDILAIDTLASQAGTDGTDAKYLRDNQSTLWNESFGVTNNSQQTNVNRAASRETLDFGAEKASNDDRIATVGAGQYGLVVATPASIACVDYLSCKEIWSVSSKAFESINSNARDGHQFIPWLSYKDGKVYAIDPIGRRRLVIDARDGEILSAGAIPVPGNIWGVFEDTFLTFKGTDGNRLNFKLCSSETGEVVLNFDASSNDKAEISGNAFVCWGESGLTFWNLKNRTEHKYDVTPGTSSGIKVKIGNLRIQRFENSLLLIGYSPNNKRDYLEKKNDIVDYQDAYGRLLAINDESGEPMWKQPIDSYFAFPFHQPRSAPAFILTRYLEYPVDGAITNTSSIALVDLKSGGLLYTSDYFPSANGAEFSATFSPQDHLLSINFRSSGIQAKWTDNAIPTREQITSLGDTSRSKLAELMPKQVHNQIIESQEEAPEQQDPFDR